MYPICCKKYNLIDIIEPNINIVIVPKDRKSLAKVECQRKKTLVIISLFVENEIVSHITRMNWFTTYVANSQKVIQAYKWCLAFATSN
jgi:hypothetical protein